MKTLLFIFSILCFNLTARGQSNSDRAIAGKQYAAGELKIALTEKGLHNVVDNKRNIIKDEPTAIKVAESILFSIYGEDNIAWQRPYETYFINNYWVISGTLPEDSKGGTFMIIIDARNSAVLRLTHGK